jgi:hypothetical protein
MRQSPSRAPGQAIAFTVVQPANPVAVENLLITF